MTRKQIPAEALVYLRQRLQTLPSRCPERRKLVEETAALYGVSTDTLLSFGLVAVNPGPRGLCLQAQAIMIASRYT